MGGHTNLENDCKMNIHGSLKLYNLISMENMSQRRRLT